MNFSVCLQARSYSRRSWTDRRFRAKTLGRHPVVEYGGADAVERHRLDPAYAASMLVLASELPAGGGNAITMPRAVNLIRAGQFRAALLMHARAVGEQVIPRLPFAMREP